MLESNIRGTQGSEVSARPRRELGRSRKTPEIKRARAREKQSRSRRRSQHLIILRFAIAKIRNTSRTLTYTRVYATPI